MWNSGAQAMNGSPGCTVLSMRPIMLRATIARWLISAPLGRPVVPLVYRMTRPASASMSATPVGSRAGSVPGAAASRSA